MIDTSLEIEAEAKAELAKRLIDKGWPSNLIIEAVENEIPYGAHHSKNWRGMDEHTRHAEAAAGNQIMAVIGNLSFEIDEKIQKKDRLKNIIRELPDGIRDRLLARIDLIEQGRRIGTDEDLRA